MKITTTTVTLSTRKETAAATRGGVIIIPTKTGTIIVVSGFMCNVSARIITMGSAMIIMIMTMSALSHRGRCCSARRRRRPIEI